MKTFYYPYKDPIVTRWIELPVQGIIGTVWVDCIIVKYKFFAFRGYEFILN